MATTTTHLRNLFKHIVANEFQDAGEDVKGVFRKVRDEFRNLKHTIVVGRRFRQGYGPFILPSERTKQKKQRKKKVVNSAAVIF